VDDGGVHHLPEYETEELQGWEPKEVTDAMSTALGPWFAQVRCQPATTGAEGGPSSQKHRTRSRETARGENFGRAVRHRQGRGRDATRSIHHPQTISQGRKRRAVATQSTTVHRSPTRPPRLLSAGLGDGRAPRGAATRGGCGVACGRMRSGSARAPASLLWASYKSITTLAQRCFGRSEVEHGCCAGVVVCRSTHRRSRSRT
jgi:hypothetical protein